MSRAPLVTIVIPTRNEGPYLAQTVAGVLQAKTAVPYTILVVDDGSTDGGADALEPYRNSGPVTVHRTPGLGVANARNLGAALATTPYLVFLDGHVFVRDHWLDPLIDLLETGTADAVCPAVYAHDRPRRVGFGVTFDGRLRYTWLPRQATAPYAVPVIPGCAFAIQTAAFRAVQGCNKRFRTWGFTDIELSLKLWVFGFRLFVHPGVRVGHVFRPGHPYPVLPEHVNANLLVLAYCHFSEPRIAKAEALVREAPYGAQLIRTVRAGDVWDARAWYLAHRVHDDDWYMARFGIPF